MNQFTVDVVLAEKSALRYSPAGIEVLEVKLSHASTQTEEGGARQVAFDIAAIAFGQMAKKLSLVAEQQHLRCSGFINRRTKKSVTLKLHLTAFELID